MLSEFSGATFAFVNLADTNFEGNAPSVALSLICLFGKELSDWNRCGQHSEQKSYDSKRDAWIRTKRFRVLRFWDHEV